VTWDDLKFLYKKSFPLIITGDSIFLALNHAVHDPWRKFRLSNLIKGSIGAVARTFYKGLCTTAPGNIGDEVELFIDSVNPALRISRNVF
jgi:hypothetical protein